MLISRELIDKTGMFDERFFLYFEDLDFACTTQAGFTIHINPDVVADHAVLLAPVYLAAPNTNGHPISNL